VRLLRHWCASQAATRRRFPREVTEAIEREVASAELKTSGEIRFAVETNLEYAELRAGKSARERAIEVFGELGVWDSELANGVLIYVLMADRDVEIVADRGAAARIPYADWEAVCRRMEEHFRAGRFREGALAGVSAVGALLAREFPARALERNEQPDRPSLL
jgi:uncharacterized membrane protein